MFSFDGSEGKAKFAHLWLLDGTQKDRSPIWAELETAMSLGCARVDNAFLMPSLSEQLPDVDVFEKLLALPGAQLRQAPHGDSRLIATLEYDLVLFDEDNDTDGWQKVALSDGRKGYVLRSQLRTALEYRAQFEKVNGRWRLTSFAEGD